MRKLLQSQSGIAILLVLAILSLLSFAVIEFSLNQRVNYYLAENESDEVKAYYMALSGIEFAKIIIKFDREGRNFAKKAAKGTSFNADIPPIYSQFPLNPLDTEILRAGLSNSGEETEESEELEESGESEESGNLIDQGTNLIDLSAIEEFLSFDGDFSILIEEEETKLNVNAFSQYKPKTSQHKRLRRTLVYLLQSPEMLIYFENLGEAEKMAGYIADYIDADTDLNNFEGEVQGSELSVYPDSKYKPKNTKLLSLDELIFVAGMHDDLLKALKKHVTIYGGDDKILLCRASDTLVKAVVASYANTNPKAQKIEMDNTKLLDQALEAVRVGCPTAKTMGSNLDKVLGVVANSTSNPVTNTTRTSRTQRTSVSAFSAMVKTDAQFFTLHATGKAGAGLQTGDGMLRSQVNVRAVLDARGQKPETWKFIFWKVQ